MFSVAGWSRRRRPSKRGARLSERSHVDDSAALASTWLLADGNAKLEFDLWKINNDDILPDLDASFTSCETDCSASFNCDDTSCVSFVPSEFNKRTTRVRFLLPAKKPQPPMLSMTPAKTSSSLLKGSIPMVKINSHREQQVESSSSLKVNRVWLVGTMPEETPRGETASTEKDSAASSTKSESNSLEPTDECAFSLSEDCGQGKSETQKGACTTAPYSTSSMAIAEESASVASASSSKGSNRGDQSPEPAWPDVWITIDDSLPTSMSPSKDHRRKQGGLGASKRSNSFIQQDRLESLANNILGLDVPSNIEIISEEEQTREQVNKAVRTFEASFDSQEAIELFFKKTKSLSSVNDDDSTPTLQIVVNGQPIDESTYRFVFMLVLLQLAFLKVASTACDAQPQLLQIQD